MKKTMTKGLLASAIGMSLFSQALLAEEVTVWAWDPNFNVAIMEEAAARYTQENPDVTFNILDFSKGEVEQKLQTMLASGVTSALPDIVLVEDYNAQKYLQSFPGSFAPMTDKVDYSSFAPYKVSVMSYKGDVYGMPFDTGVTGMYYRTDILEKAGFSAEDMQNITWERYLEIGKQVKEKTGVAMLGTNPDDLAMVRIMMQSGGEWYFNEDGSLNITENESLKEALEVFRQLMSDDISRPAVGWSEWVGTVNRGQVATITTGVWITPSVKASDDQNGKWSIAPTPRLSKEGSVNASNLGGSSWYVLGSSKVTDTAIDFLNDVYAKDVNFYETILKERGAVGSYLPSAKSEAYQYTSDFFDGQQIYTDFAGWLVDIPQVNYGIYTYEVDAAISSQMPALMQGMPVEAMLERVQQQLEYQLR
ncbi:extracellular solute-binding protein [Vibrio sp. ZSDE26]|uniref:Extracellular solute-binding protein n=1 Tax=Vibrio amylolyticus TaxID=2847292 RepID=A0A9X1XIF6_9VIBR|nr:extracellular solute-binding protein [Vibrio amylolyticus]MCK6262473.1 extracellular solute-binding protein [Vibrio amylolyticus]